MLPALHNQINDVTGGHPENAHEIADKHRRQYFASIELPISEEVFTAMDTIPRVSFLEPILKIIDASSDDGVGLFRTALSGLVAQHVIEGETVPIWIIDDLYINATDTVIVAEMIDRTLPEDPARRGRALVVGSGSGYVPAVLQELGFREVIGIERIEELAGISKESLHNHGYDRVEIITGNAAAYIDQLGQFDAILVFAELDSENSEHLTFLYQILMCITPEGRIIVPFKYGDTSQVIQIECRESGAERQFFQVSVGSVPFTPFMTE
ncbi:methyltransferase domain-containing protein [Candidatus Gottesmanbacteria bacterium]|nr:methyltransferase domain-containing protein [Candidatus Gottesmanbacteria bacterium]